MTRLLALAVAATLAIAPSTSAWCRAWCDRQHQQAMSTECHHHADSDAAAMTADGSCADAVAHAVVYVGTDAPRVSAPVSSTAHAYGRLVFAPAPGIPYGSPLMPTRTPAAVCARATVLRI